MLFLARLPVPDLPFARYAFLICASVALFSSPRMEYRPLVSVGLLAIRAAILAVVIWA
jgi:hypothetical protein